MSALIALDVDILTTETLSVTAGTADAAYPVTNVQDKKSHTVCKATGTSITIQASFGTPQSLEAVALINTNASTITLTNAAGLNESIAVPITPRDGVPLDPWIDLRGLANTSSTAWSVALGTITGVGLGEFVLIHELRQLDFQLGSVKVTKDHPSSERKTDFGVSLVYGKGIRTWSCEGDVKKRSLESLAWLIGDDLRGMLKSAILILDSSVNDARYVQLVEAIDLQYGETSDMSTRLRFDERQRGLTLATSEVP